MECGSCEVSHTVTLDRTVNCDNESVSEKDATCKKFTVEYTAKYRGDTGCPETNDDDSVEVICGPPCGECPPECVCDLDATDPDAFKKAKERTLNYILENFTDGCGGEIVEDNVVCFDKVLCKRCCRNEKSIIRHWFIRDKCFDSKSTPDEKKKHQTVCIQFLRSVNKCWNKYFPAQCECPCKPPKKEWDQWREQCLEEQGQV